MADRATRRPFLIRWLAGVWEAVTWMRRVVFNLLFLLLLALTLAILLPGGGPEVEKTTALVVEPTGFLTEELAGYPGERALMRFIGRGLPAESLLRTLVEAVDRAVDDERVKVLLLDLDRMAGGGLAKLHELGLAIERFRDSGKEVIAYADFYGQPQYYLASLANEVYLHEQGMVLLQGYGSYRNYYREAIDALEIDWHVFRAGEFKSAVEPYTRSGMSDEAREARLAWLEALWSSYTGTVAPRRGLEPEAIDHYAATLDEQLAVSGGDAARAALAAGLVDKVVPRDALRERLVELVGEGDDGEYRRIGYKSYLEALGPKRERGSETVAVIVAKGTILDGNQPPGTVGGESTARRIRGVLDDESIKALVLRIDSPGGSVFASELIRRELELVREAGVPVVASMGSVAASGGYWISLPASEVIASPDTVTGSIGVFAMFPTFDRTLGKIGVRTDGVGTTPLAGALRPDRPLSPQIASAIQQIVDRDYREFLERTAASRDKTPDEIDAVARGRVWAGSDAHRLGLVDRLGTFADAIDRAAELAGIEEGGYRVRYLAPEPDPTDSLLEILLSKVELPSLPRLRAPLPAEMVEVLRREVDLLSRSNDPFASYAYCFCQPN